MQNENKMLSSKIKELELSNSILENNVSEMNRQFFEINKAKEALLQKKKFK
jgi:hypothetical protein